VSERKRILVLTVVMALIAIFAVGMTSITLYRSTIEWEEGRLRESVQSKGSLITAIVENEEERRRQVGGFEAEEVLLEQTLRILVKAHAQFRGFGETGEFTLGKREGDQIVFLLSHRHYDLDRPRPIPFSSPLGEPMGRALSGQSGTGILVDYRGARVIAAYESLPVLGLGLVGKIDLAEVQARFIETGMLLGAGSLALITLGAILFLHIGSPLIEHLEESEKRYRALAENLQEEVKRKVAELQEAERMAAIGRMLSVVAHEVRNPLQHIRLGAETLRIYLGQDKEKLEVIKEIEQGVTTLDKIIGDLLEYSRPVSLKYSSVQSGALVRQSLDMLSPRLDNISMQIELEREERELSVDPDKISQVFVNVISNSIEAMNGSGRIQISSRFFKRDGVEHLEFLVTDSGPGMSEEILKRADEPFFTTKIWGGGLGIPICKKILDAHNGNLNVRSKPGEGTTVEITMPVRRNAKTNVHPEKNRPA